MGRWIVGITLLGLIGFAHADFVWRPAQHAVEPTTAPVAKPPVAAAQPEPVLASCAPGVTREIGLSPAHPELTRAGARPTDVTTALRAILPDGWVLRAEVATAAPDRSVSWRDGLPWPDVVADIAREGAACLTVDYPAQAVTIEPLPSRRTMPEGALVVGAPVAAPAVSPPGRPVPPVAAGAPTTRVATPAAPSAPEPPVVATKAVTVTPARIEPPAPAAPKPVVSTRPVPSAVPVEVIGPATPSYRLKAGETVRETLERWCQDSHWTLIWDSTLDYPVDVGHIFPQGTTLRQAIERVLSAYWGQANPLVARIYQNQVVQIVPGHD